MKKLTIFLILFISVFLLSACDSDDSNYVNDKKEVETDTTDETGSTIDLTLSELAMYDGLDGQKAYIAVNGIIYDVTDEWTNGSHNGVDAGNDVTNEIMRAPHGESILENLTIIGNLITN